MFHDLQLLFYLLTSYKSATWCTYLRIYPPPPPALAPAFIWLQALLSALNHIASIYMQVFESRAMAITYVGCELWSNSDSSIVVSYPTGEDWCAVVPEGQSWCLPSCPVGPCPFFFSFSSLPGDELSHFPERDFDPQTHQLGACIRHVACCHLPSHLPLPLPRLHFILTPFSFLVGASSFSLSSLTLASAGPPSPPRFNQ